MAPGLQPRGPAAQGDPGPSWVGLSFACSSHSRGKMPTSGERRQGFLPPPQPMEELKDIIMKAGPLWMFAKEDRSPRGREEHRPSSPWIYSPTLHFF